MLIFLLSKKCLQFFAGENMPMKQEVTMALNISDSSKIHIEL